MSEQQQSTALVPRIVAPELDRHARMGKWLAAAEAENPSEEQKGAAASLRLALVEEMGLPLRSASLVSIVRGRLVVHVELMRAIAHDAGYTIRRLEESPESVTAAVYDQAGEEIGRATFTMAQARKAKLVKSGGAYETYPERMLWARAAGFAMRDTIPHVVLGLAISDERGEIERGEYHDELVDVELDPRDIRDEDDEPEQQPDPEPAAQQA